MTSAAHSNDPELARRVAETSPEQLASMLLKAGQRSLLQVIQAMDRKDHAAKALALARVSEIIDELSSRLNREAGGELVGNLTRIYEWWTCELILASMQNECRPFEDLSRWMGELNESWEQLHRMKMPPPRSRASRMAGLPA